MEDMSEVGAAEEESAGVEGSADSVGALAVVSDCGPVLWISGRVIEGSFVRGSGC